ncbi:MAG: hypothetical protein R3F59_06740 [Myxococcota bacterium]
MSVRAGGIGMGALLWAAALTGCSSVTAEGHIVDGLTGEPIPGPYRIKARSTSRDVALTCQLFDTEVGADGAFKLEQLCSGTSYQLSTDRDDLWLVEIDTIPEGGFGQPTDLTAWRVPKGSGVYKLSGGELTMLRTASNVEQDTIFGTDQTVRLPDTLPEKVDRIDTGDYLVLVGKATIEEMKLVPLVPSGPRKFGTAEEPYARNEPWWYLGTKFTDDTTFERVEARPDASKVVDKSKDDRAGRFIAGGALPAGRYALLKDDDKRMFLLDFGAAPAEAPVPAPAPAPAEP